MKIKTLNEAGAGHYVLPVIVVAVIALIGVKVLTGSHADSIDSTQATTNTNKVSLSNFTLLGKIASSDLYNVKVPPSADEQPVMKIFACSNNLANGQSSVEYISALSYAIPAWVGNYWNVYIALSSSNTTNTQTASYQNNNWLPNSNGNATQSTLQTTGPISNPSTTYLWASGSFGGTVYQPVSNHPSVSQLKSCPPQNPYFQPPSNLKATRIMTDEFFKSFTPAAESNGTIASYDLYRYKLSDGIGSAVLYAKGSTGTTGSVVSLSPATGYGFYEIAYDSKGNRSQPSEPLTVVTASPGISAPGGLTASSVTSTSFTMNFNSSTDSSGSITAYDLYRYLRNEPSQFSSTILYKKNIKSTQISIGGLKPNTAYGFYMVANDSTGNHSNPSSDLVVTTTP